MTSPSGTRGSPVVSFICAASVACGLVTAFRLVTPELVGRLTTIQLLGMLGMIVLPGVCWWLGRLERRMGSAMTARIRGIRR